ncbi:two-component response regulator-like APRR5 [Raphanus sativus]|uniref:Two-component response regulator-like APRR5 n=1 Tax=Raphanus sativus TaxID=3726 RepID=A0A6J0JUF1_RAPSA|nr:two-component response regulator-like APRR5 [Raphanus sativus]XP_056845830.1 two-component response regulator-like APRR5 [Raphanus sativus]
MVVMTRAHVQDQRCKVRAQTWRTQLKKPFDFMGASFRRNAQRNREKSVARYESMIELDLSLRRPNTCENQSSAEKPSLHPSSASVLALHPELV